MSLDEYKVARDKFEYDDHSMMIFPCCVCKHRYGQIKDEPCRTCDHNANSENDDKEIANEP